MILLKEILLTNFLSHDKTAIDFGNGEKILLSGNSGAGKSSIIDAIIFNLFGKGRTDNNKGLIRIGQKEAVVSILLTDKDIYYRIIRSINLKGKQSLDITQSDDNATFVPLASVGLKDSQLWLEKTLLKSSYAMFINSVAWTQDNNDSFVKQTAVKRKELLLEIVDTQDFELYYNRAKTELSLVNENMIRTEAEIAGYDRTIEANKEADGNIDLLKLQLKEIQARMDQTAAKTCSLQDKAKAMDEIVNEIKTINQEINYCVSVIDKNDVSIKDKKSQIEQIRSVDTDKLNKDVLEMNVLKSELERLELLSQQEVQRSMKLRQLSDRKPANNTFQLEIDDLNDKMMSKILDKNLSCGHVCGSCGNVCANCPKLEEQKKKEIAEMESKITDLSLKLNIYNQAMVQFNAEKEALEKEVVEFNYSDLATVKNKIAELVKSEYALATLTARREHADALEDEWALLEQESAGKFKQIQTLEASIEEKKKMIDEKEIATIKEMINEANLETKQQMDELNEMSRKIGSAESSKKVLEEAMMSKAEKTSKLKEDRNKSNKLSAIKEAFGSKGLKTIVIDYILPKLEDKINFILDKLSDFTVSLETQKPSSDGESIIEGLFINIFNDKHEQLDYNSYSGGEKMKITYSIFEALSSFQKCGFRLLDESVSGLHADHADKFANVMLHLDKQDTQVLCISHIPEIKEKFPDVITIEKINGVSKII